MVTAMAGSGARRVRRERDGRVEDILDDIAAEVPVALAYNGEPFAVMMATPDDLSDFALGFSLSEGIVERADEVRIDAVDELLDGISVAMTVPTAKAEALRARRRSLEGRSGCGICGGESIEAVLRTPPPVGPGPRVAVAALRRAQAELRHRQPLNARTGATHAAAWSDVDGGLVLVREDVGRHNALDKLIGAMAGSGVDPQAGFALVSSRASFELVMKSAQVGITLLAAVSAPTTLAIALADSAGMTLIGFARDDGQAVYSHPARLSDALTAVVAGQEVEHEQQ